MARSVAPQHRLEEIREIGDRVTVLKDGRAVAVGLDAKSTPTQTLVAHMTGRQVEYAFPPRKDLSFGREALRVERLSRVGEFDDVSFTVSAGEIVGFAGLVGSGRSELLETIFGARTPASGRVMVEGRPLRYASVPAAVRAGIGLAPRSASRKHSSTISRWPPTSASRRSAGSLALRTHGLSVSAQQSAEFTVESGQAVMAQLMQANPQIDAVFNHDDDQGIGVLAAIEEASGDEFFLVGGGGSSNMLELIEADDSVVKATTLYSPSMSASAVWLARLIAQNRGMSDLIELEVPKTVVVYSAAVTSDNAADYKTIGYQS